MGIPVLILGESGSGKSTSLRNFDPDEVGIFNVAGKPLPFRKQLTKVDRPDYATILKTLMAHNKKRYVIDDSQYLLAFDLFDRVNESGYDKFTEMAVSFYHVWKIITEKTPNDVIVYFLHHIKTADDGKVKAKTVGKMLDEKLTVEGLFSIVLLCRTDGTRHYFETQSNGLTPTKSPIGMFDGEIDNDLKMVDTTIRNYYNLGGVAHE